LDAVPPSQLERCFDGLVTALRRALSCVGVGVHELKRRFRGPDGWLPLEVASALVEYGHVGDVRLLADQGDWNCAHTLVQVLLVQGQVNAALDILRPFADSGLWQAVERLAGILDAHDRTDEAITLVRLHAPTGGRFTGTRLAALLARQGRTDEVVALLGPYVGDSYYAEALVSLTAGTGHDDEVASLLQVQIGAKQQHVNPWQREPWNAEALLAKVLERQGRVDDAVALLQAHLHRGEALFDNHIEQLAEILVRHGREAQLRALLPEAGGEHAAFRLAAWLEEQARVDDAVEALQPFTTSGSPNAAAVLAEMLTRHGRVDEAINMLRPVPKAMGGDPEWVIHMLCSLLVEQGRADEALATIDDLAAHHGGMWIELHLERTDVLARCGRIEQAIAELRDHPVAGAWYVTTRLADLLVDAGRPEEAIAVLRAGDRTVMSTTNLAKLLIRRGRVKEAVELFHAETAAKEAAKIEEDAAFWGRFRAGDQPSEPRSAPSLSRTESQSS
jgi:tetratricopeptide (TPR) repeat protein